jgi:hypothetical protein
MCIAILNPADGAELSRRQVRNCYHNNPDGCGMAWSYGGKLYTWRSVNSGYRSFIKQYRAVRELGVSVVAHFRLATHGRRDEDNCHPFLVKDGQLAVVHNGIITQADKAFGGKENRHKSDTWLFCENILESLPEEWWDDEGLLELVSDYLSGSKLIILPTDGRWVIINPGLGDWEKDGNWYSNSTHNYESRQSYYGKGWEEWYGGVRHTNYTNGQSAKTGAARNPAYRDPEGALVWDGDEAVPRDFEIWDPHTRDWEKTESLWTPRDEDEDLGPDIVDGAYIIEGFVVCDICIDGFGEDAWHAEEVYDKPGEAIRCEICEVLLNDPHGGEEHRKSTQLVAV